MLAALKKIGIKGLLIYLGAFIVGCSSIDGHAKPKIDTTGQPTIGHSGAPVQVVVFEEPKCSECKLFSTLIYPLIKQKYIDTGKIQYTLLPVSFISDSMNASMAWVCVYDQKKDGDLFFKYVEKTYTHQGDEDVDWATPEQMIKFAQETSPEIDLEALKTCLAKQAYKSQIEKNTDIGIDLMEGSLGTPAVYVNGKPIEVISLEAISKAIDQNLK